MAELGPSFGPYEIGPSIGAGGMGVVYRARDSRLGRAVAVKVLPPEFAADVERLRRFEQEAHAAAALNHPNVLSIYDVGRQPNGAPYIVSELLEGESLRGRLRSGAMPLRKVADFGAQIARGLAAAHDKGIVHRDLKPENIFLTSDGRAKILDFGLAKLTERHRSTVQSSAPTENATEPGMVFGTVGYMAPEQVRGQEADHRSDIFSFGAILYEMLTGQRAFRGDSQADTMSAILKEEPPPVSPPGLGRLVSHCLEKSPNDRFQSAGDIAFNLEEISDTSTASVAVAPDRRKRKGAAVAVLAFIAVGALAAIAVRSFKNSEPSFHQLTYRHGVINSAVFTPDGRNVIYSASWEGAPEQLYSVPSGSDGGRPLDISDARILGISSRNEMAVLLTPRTAGGGNIQQGTLATVPLTGGSPKPQIENVLDAAWTPDGSALAIIRWVPEGRVCQLEYPIGHVLYKDGWLVHLRFARDGRSLAFLDHPIAGDDRGRPVVVSVDAKTLLEGQFLLSVRGLAWSPSGREVWVTSPLQSGSVFAYSLDGQVRELLRTPGRLYIRDALPDGRVLANQGIQKLGLITINRDTHAQRDLSWMGWPILRAISGDGSLVAISEETNANHRYEVMVRRTDGSTAIVLGEGDVLALSPDNRWVLSAKVTGSPFEIWLYPVGAGEPRKVGSPSLVPLNSPASFFSDSRRFVFAASRNGGPSRLYVQDINGGEPTPLPVEAATTGRVSPDDRYLFINAAGGYSIFTIADGTMQAIRGLADQESPVDWSDDGKLFIFRRSGPRFSFEKLDPFTGARTPWFEYQFPSVAGLSFNAPFVSRNGQTLAFRYGLTLSDLYEIQGLF